MLFTPAIFAAETQLLPDWTSPSTSGDEIRLSHEVQQQPVVLFFWASWCPYCKALMPHLQSMRLEYGDDVKILAIQIKDKKDAAVFMTEAGYDFVVLPHGDDVADVYEIYGTPGVIVVDQQQMSRFDLRDLPSLPDAQKKEGHKSKAAYLAPYWAAAIRQSIDSVLAD